MAGRPRPLPGRPRWSRRVDTHLDAGSTARRGGTSTAAAASRAGGRGLDVLAVTDHNTVSHHAHLGAAGDHAGILLLPGQEVTTDAGHANCFGAIGWIDFRDPPDRWQAAATERGGLMSVNHPWAWDCAWRMPLVGPADLVEMWHWTWDRRDVTAGDSAWFVAGGIVVAYCP